MEAALEKAFAKADFKALHKPTIHEPQAIMEACARIMNKNEVAILDADSRQARQLTHLGNGIRTLLGHHVTKDLGRYHANAVRKLFKAANAPTTTAYDRALKTCFMQRQAEKQVEESKTALERMGRKIRTLNPNKYQMDAYALLVHAHHDACSMVENVELLHDAWAEGLKKKRQRVRLPKLKARQPPSYGIN